MADRQISPPDPLATWQGQPLMPFDMNERITWVFLQGIQQHCKDRDFAMLCRSLAKDDAKIEFAVGLAQGAYHGASLAINEYIKDVTELLRVIMHWVREYYEITYDLAILEGVIRVWATAANTNNRLQALHDCAALFEKHHPAAAAAMRTLAEVEPVLRSLAKWLQQPGAIAQVLVVLSRDLGQKLGEELEQIFTQLQKPLKMGDLIGKRVGQIVMQVALFLLGF